MNTLTDLKQALDNGETITDGLAIIYKSTWDGKYFFHGKLVVSEITWDEIKDFVDPSLWRQRDQKPTHDGTETNWIQKDETGQYTPRMVVVDAREWDALQIEIAELRYMNVSLIQQLKEQEK